MTLSGPFRLDYRTNPKALANRVLVSWSALEDIAYFIEGSIPLSAEILLQLAMLAESVALNEQLIVTYGLSVARAHDFEHWTAMEDLAAVLQQDHVIDGVDAGSAGRIITEQIEPLDQRWDVIEDELQSKGFVVEGKHFEDLEKPEMVVAAEAGKRIARDLTAQAAAMLGCTTEEAMETYGTVPVWDLPWVLVANACGIPYCSDGLYPLRDISWSCPTNISAELYGHMEALNKTRFAQIRKYLGPTFLRLPSVLSLVLSRCEHRTDIPNAMLEVRERFSKFRRTCTALEYDLRCAQTIEQQYTVIASVESAYGALEKRVNSIKSRIVYKVFDVVKHVNPIKMATTALDMAKQYDLDREGLIKIPGYYDLWKASLEVAQARPLLEQVFDEEITPAIVRELDSLMAMLGEKQ